MSPLARRLREEIRTSGPMPFAEFMQRALYDPDDGYYARLDGQIGRRGDFITSVSVGPLFGELLAFQFARWLVEISQLGTRGQIVEVGAHDGQLAHDILKAMAGLAPGLVGSFEYWIVEPSPLRRAVQEKRLAEFRNARWADHLSSIEGGVRGVIFSNELLDAMPVHPFAWNAPAGKWEEIGVTEEGEGFSRTRLAEATTEPPVFPPELLQVLPDGYVFELGPAAIAWWRSAARALVQGHLLAIDYGGVLEEMLSPSRTGGTLRAYFRHRASGDVLANPGEQDLTAHVNFSAIRAAGESEGLTTTGFCTQSQFLTGLARDLWARSGSWPVDQVRQFQTLTHPEHLGRPFRVLIQAR